MNLAIVGDFNPAFEPHPLTDAAIEHASRALGLPVTSEWVGTEDVAARGAGRLSGCDAVWIAPGSPYKSLKGALAAIHYARTNGVPLLGTCAGFQHVVVEFARNVLGWEDAHSAEYGAASKHFVVVPVTCAIAGKVLPIDVAPDSLAHTIYGRSRIEERYYCRYGLNPDAQELMHRHGLRVVGTDENDEARIVELTGHPFYFATLFVPQARSTPDAPHPVIAAFLRAER